MSTTFSFTKVLRRSATAWANDNNYVDMIDGILKITNNVIPTKMPTDYILYCRKERAFYAADQYGKPYKICNCIRLDEEVDIPDSASDLKTDTYYYEDIFHIYNNETQTVFRLTHKPLNEIRLYIDGLRYFPDTFTYDAIHNTVKWTNTNTNSEGFEITDADVVIEYDYIKNEPNSFSNIVNGHEDEFWVAANETRDIFPLTFEPIGKIRLYIDGVRYFKNTYTYNSDINSVIWTNTDTAGEGFEITDADVVIEYDYEKIDPSYPVYTGYYINKHLDKFFVDTDETRVIFPLTHKPIGKINLYIDGVRYFLDSYSYDAQNNSITWINTNTEKEGFEITDADIVFEYEYFNGLVESLSENYIPLKTCYDNYYIAPGETQVTFTLTHNPVEIVALYIDGLRYFQDAYTYDEETNSITWINIDKTKEGFEITDADVVIEYLCVKEAE